jgi:hypothetical protein
MFVSKAMHYKIVWVKDRWRVLCRPQRIQRVTYPFPSTRRTQKCVAIPGHPAASERPHPHHHRGPSIQRVETMPRWHSYPDVCYLEGALMESTALYYMTHYTLDNAVLCQNPANSRYLVPLFSIQFTIKNTCLSICGFQC